MSAGLEVIASIVLVACIIAGTWEKGPAKKRGKVGEYLIERWTPMMVVLNIAATILALTITSAWSFFWLNLGGIILGGIYLFFVKSGGSHGGSH